MKHWFFYVIVVIPSFMWWQNRAAFLEFLSLRKHCAAKHLYGSLWEINPSHCKHLSYFQIFNTYSDTYIFIHLIRWSSFKPSKQLMKLLSESYSKMNEVNLLISFIHDISWNKMWSERSKLSYWGSHGSDSGSSEIVYVLSSK